MIRLLLVSLALGTVSQHVEEVTFSFKPGKIGLGASWSSGHVTRVDRRGQAEDVGVEVGMTMIRIGSEEYSEALLDKMIAGKKDYSITFERPPPPPKKADSDIPPKPTFVHAIELSPDTYDRMVYDVTNGSKSASPPYFPVVMFHMSWCKHCRHALPEYEQAAEMVQVGSLSKSFDGYKAVPKFFLMECDASSAHRSICDVHTETRYPAVRLFRDGRAIEFNRPRIAETFAHWAARVARPPIMMMVEKSQVEAAAAQSVIFLLCADLQQHASSVKAWEQVALDNLDTQSFLLVTPDSSAGHGCGPAPSVTAKGPGIDPLPFSAPITIENLAPWVNFNKFMDIESLNPYSAHALKASREHVVVLVYNSQRAGMFPQVVDSFTTEAKRIRKDGKFLFATIDVESKENAEYLDAVFPLVAPTRATPPQVFVFSGPDTYWECPGYIKPTQLTAERIESLISKAEFTQDGSVWSTIKDRRKRLVRMATGSTLGGAIAVFVPVLMTLIGRVGLKSLLSGDDEAGKDTKKD
mmetsp:Transcript_51493/g.95255  ORF Transcript_51493/g.95255 Transcript_51493/m.95255 type:complete len:524 (+) Transcript_51493:58-1629(+)